jgi:hypothetical protein
MKDSTLMKYDPNTGSNCFYTSDMGEYNLKAATEVLTSNYTILYT